MEKSLEQEAWEYGLSPKGTMVPAPHIQLKDDYPSCASCGLRIYKNTPALQVTWWLGKEYADDYIHVECEAAWYA